MFALLAAALLGQGPMPAAGLSARVDQIVTQHVKPDGPGGAVLVLKHGKVLHRKGYGLASVEHQAPITPQTVFELASVSKQFTAAAVLLLADRGQLALDGDVRQFVPELAEHDPKRPIRINDLLHHTSGLPEYLREVLATRENPQRIRLADVPRLIAGKKLEFPTGTKWKYSNTNYALLALIVERVGGKKFSQFMKEEVFAPLGMSATLVLDDPETVVPHRATGYTASKLRGLLRNEQEFLILGAAGVRTSLDDFAKWDDAIRTGKLLKPETWKLAFTPGRLDDGKPHQYGCGWGIGPGFVNHSGSWAGFRSFVMRFPAEELTVVVLSNDGAFPLIPVVNAIIELYHPG